MQLIPIKKNPLGEGTYFLAVAIADMVGGRRINDGVPECQLKTYLQSRLVRRDRAEMVVPITGLSSEV
jgi:hypothetical protein